MADFDHWGGNWTTRKIATLRKYLQSFQTALKNTAFQRSYIDALAGDGTWRRRSRASAVFPGLDDDEKQAVDTIREGSALVALGIEPPFDKYVFNDLDSGKAAALKKRAIEKGIPVTAIEIEALDANEFIRNVCDTMNSRIQRGVVLLDPWGMQVDWSAIKVIADTHCLDMWYLFPTQPVLRLLTRAGMPPEPWCVKLDTSLGTTSWRTEFYRPVVGSDDLFGQRPHEQLRREASFDSVEAFVVQRLKETFSGSVLDTPLRLGPRNHPFFSFFFASGNPSPKAKALTERLARAVVRVNRE